jgi:hypothetical protein
VAQRTERDPPAGHRIALWIPAVVLIVGLLIRAILAGIWREQWLRNPSRLLRLRRSAAPHTTPTASGWSDSAAPPDF